MGLYLLAANEWHCPSWLARHACWRFFPKLPQIRLLVGKGGGDKANHVPPVSSREFYERGGRGIDSGY